MEQDVLKILQDAVIDLSPNHLDSELPGDLTPDIALSRTIIDK